MQFLLCLPISVQGHLSRSRSSTGSTAVIIFSSNTFCSSPGEGPMACFFEVSTQGQICFLSEKRVLEANRNHAVIALLYR